MQTTTTTNQLQIQTNNNNNMKSPATISLIDLYNDQIAFNQLFWSEFFESKSIVATKLIKMYLVSGFNRKVWNRSKEMEIDQKWSK